MKIVVGILLFLVGIMLINPACANSYLEMLTTEPENQTDNSLDYRDRPIEENVPNTNWWYDSRIVTRSPVVVSPYPKYYAWARAQADGNQFDHTHEYIQNTIYVIEGGLLGWGLYEIFKH